ncbi:unnamed protein product [Laminaria digitata]
MADIMSRLSRALPPADYTTDEASFCRQLEGRRRDFKPPGARVFEYKRGATTFSVYRATGEDPGAGDYHARAQCLAPWFIEAADPIDLTDDRWEVFYLFEEETTREVLGEKWRPAALAGYFTLFGFRNPVKGVSLRICQALILPRFQRQGHGQALLAYLYDLARSRDSVFEITVEDPAPGFEKVRNLVDARTLRDSAAFPAELLSPGTFKRPSKEVIQAAHKAVKLTVSQTEIGFDILKARDLQTAKDSRSSAARTYLKGTPAPAIVAAGPGPGAAAAAAAVSVSDADEICEDKRKQYRLMVKRRLLKRYAEELSTDAPTRKRQLEELYRDLEPGFLSLGAKLLEKKIMVGVQA